MRIVFLGTPRIAVPSLDALVTAGHEIPLVVSQPDRPAGRSGTPVGPPVKQRALELGLDVRQPATLRDTAIRAELEAVRPDILVVVAYGRILPGRVLRAAPRGAINVHFSLLPSYRGAAPVQWALANGDEVTGVTTMQVAPRLDEGDLLLQCRIDVEPNEHAPALAARLSEVGAELLLETIDGLRNGTLDPAPQDDSRASLAPLLSREDGEIDPDLTAREIEGRIRGFDPWPGVWLLRRGKRIRLLEARCLDDVRPEEPPGRVLDLKPHGPVMVCGGGTLLRLIEVQPEGRRPMPADDAVNGRQLAPGDRLESLRRKD